MKEIPNTLSLLAQNDVRRIHYQIELARDNWKEIKCLLPKLTPYARDFGYEVRSEIISAAATVSNYTRRGIPKDVVETLINVLIQTLPIYSVVAPSKHKPSKKDIDLISRTINIANDILWDTCRYLRNIEITEGAAYLLSYILKHAHLNKLKNVEKMTLEVVTNCEKICDEKRNAHRFLEGKKILKKLKNEALTLD